MADVGRMTTTPPSDVRLARARIIVITVGFVLVGAASGDIFDRAEWTLAIAPLPPAAARSRSCDGGPSPGSPGRGSRCSSPSP